MIRLTSRTFALIVILILATLFVISFIIGTARKEAAFHSTETSNKLYMNTKDPPPKNLKSVLVHEMLHFFRGNFTVLIDVPTAAASQYIHEYMNSKEIVDVSVRPDFNRGKESEQVAAEIDRVMQPYWDEPNSKETKKSYMDGAYIAGMIYKLFGNDTPEKGLNYIYNLSLGFDHHTSLYIMDKENLKDLVINGMLRGGFAGDPCDIRYSENSEVRNQLQSLATNYREIFEKYCNQLKKDHMIVLVPQSYDCTRNIDYADIPAIKTEIEKLWNGDFFNFPSKELLDEITKLNKADRNIIEKYMDKRLIGKYKFCILPDKGDKNCVTGGIPDVK